MQFEIYLVRAGVVSAESLVDALELQLRSRPLFGRLALESGMLTIHQVAEILQRQCDVDKPFGETAVDLGYLTQRQVTQLLKLQQKRAPKLIQCLVEIGAVNVESLKVHRDRFRVHMYERVDPASKPSLANSC